MKDTFPSDFSSGVFAGTPTGSSSLYFKGTVPSGVPGLISASGLSVNTFGNVGKNFEEWHSQYDAVVAWLESHDYDTFVVAFDDVGTIEVLIGNGDSLPVLPVQIDDDVVITGAGGSLLTHQWVRGGSALFNLYEDDICTSSWSVEEQGTGVRGIVTASHCAGVAQAADLAGNLVPTTWQDEHYGTHGDLEWHTTTDAEPPTFWADEDDSRDVLSVKGNFSRNDYVCVYGRASNVRTCDNVYRTEVALGGGLHHMVIMDEMNTISGDSGGGWSIGNEAVGVHTGYVWFNNASRNCYSKANRIDNALDVEVRLATP